MKKIIALFTSALIPLLAGAQKDLSKFEYLDIFDLEYISEPQISPDGSKIIYVRNFKDIMTDRNLSNLWIINFDGSGNRPLTSGNNSDFSPRWAPDGNRVLYKSNKEDKVQLYLRWLDSGSEAKLTNLTQSPGAISWSPDGNLIAFTMFVPETSPTFISLPDKPEGAKWNDPPKYIDKLKYRADGSGYIPGGYAQWFVLYAEGGTPRQITSGPYNHGGEASWTRNSQSIVFSANRHDNWEYDPVDSEIFKVGISDLKIEQLTDRHGRDYSPKVSPDGTKIAYLGSDVEYQGYQLDDLYIMNIDGSGKKVISANFDRRINNIQWTGDNKGLFFQYDNAGNTKIAYMSVGGNVKDLAENIGGLSLGRPYSGGSFTASVASGKFAFTHGEPDHPADLAVGGLKNSVQRLTRINYDLFSYKKLGEVEEFWFESSFDSRKIQAWICKPPDFDPTRKYPLILEIHGGPFANYGSRFSAEIQLYASNGYVVLYVNPRGSSSYGEEFGNLIHHAYPGYDYDDLMSGVDALIAKGYIDNSNLYVTGGSGGGVLSAWIVGHTNRFRAAVVAKPVINWYSFVLNAETYYKFWFPGFPWDHLDHYMERSPISYAGNIETPTMLLTGESDFRTPISETEQFYAALKLRKIDAAMVRIPDASHGIAVKPSNLIAKVAYILGWFEKYRVSD